MSLIDKGVDASLFNSGKNNAGSLRRLVVLNLAFTMIGIGLGITFAILLYNATGEDAVYPASIFCMAGVGLLSSFFVNRRLKDD
jgi:ABC-type antimicrobial peptide transport system permease subunit